jgi:DNA-directed RNA polymerase specialized sigma24 family protein
MSEPSSLWQTTCSAIRAGHDPGWDAIGDYRQPLLLLLAARHGWIPAAEREDLVHEILVDLAEGLARRFDPDRGRFRAFLCGVVRNKVLARWKRRRREVPLGPEDGEPAPIAEQDGEAVDVAAHVLGAVRRWHDRASAARDGMARVYVMAGRLVRDAPLREIAERERLSIDAVKRILVGAREEIIADALEHGLPLDPEHKVGLDWRALARRAQEALADPRRRGAVLEAIGQEAVRRALEDWLDDLARLRRDPPGAGSQEGTELRRGLEEIFALESKGPRAVR